MGRFPRTCFVVLLLTALICSTAASEDIKPFREKLNPYNIDIRQSSVSGLSAGGFMAGQFFVAYSGIMSGVGVFAGGPYGCARGSLWKALNDCMARPSFLTAEAMAQLREKAGSYSREGRIDPVENLKTKRIFLFGGMADKTVPQAVVDRAYDWYLDMGVPQSNIHYKKDMMAGHAFPTIRYGNRCEEANRPPWMSACNYDGAGEALKHIYGPLHPASPVTKASGKLIEFAQAAFVDPQPPTPGDLAKQAGLNEFGYAYIPQSCLEGRVCRIHVVFHGCRQVYNQDPRGGNMEKDGVAFGLQMVLRAGYNEWANTNQIIVLYPQAQKNKANPYGCFDWWDYLDCGKDAYLTKEAPQMKAVRAMMKALSGK